MALTPGGNPYPLGTDKVVDGDDAIHALATALDNVYSRTLPTLNIGGAAAPVGGDLTWIRKGFRVSGALTITLGSGGPPAGQWTLVLPTPAAWRGANTWECVGHGWYSNGGAVFLFAMTVHTSNKGAALVMPNDGSFGGYSAAPVAGGTVVATFDYESATLP